MLMTSGSSSSVEKSVEKRSSVEKSVEKSNVPIPLTWEQKDTESLHLGCNPIIQAAY